MMHDANQNAAAGAEFLSMSQTAVMHGYSWAHPCTYSYTSLDYSLVCEEWKEMVLVWDSCENIIL